MNTAVDRTSGLRTGDGIDEVVEFATFIRERPVTCRWSAGEVSGDPQLLERLSHVVVADGWAEHPSSVARAISAAVGSAVTIRIVQDHEIAEDHEIAQDHEIHVVDHVVPSAPFVLPDPVTNTDASVLGDYWLG